jgi:Flp pilus assembly pilin Flp
MSSRIVNLRRITALHQLVRSRGLSTVEYVIILVLVAAVSVATWTAFGKKMKEALGLGAGHIDSCLQGNCNDTSINPGKGSAGDGKTPAAGDGVSPGGAKQGVEATPEPAAQTPKRKFKEE